MPIIIDPGSTEPLLSIVHDAMPYVPSAMEFAVEIQVREAAREFCRRSRIWRQANTALATTVADQSEYDLNQPDAAEVIWLASAWVGTNEADVELPGEVDDVQPGTSGNQWKVGLTVDGTLRLTPAPDTAGVEIVGTVVFGPSDDATTLPTFIHRRWRWPIMHGAIAALQSEVGKPWSKPSDVPFHRDKFEDGVREAANLTGPARRRPLRARTY